MRCDKGRSTASAEAHIADITLDHIGSHFSFHATFTHSSNHSSTQHLCSSPLLLPTTSVAMSEEVKIDKETFQNRLSHLVTTWKGDKRQTNDALFGGVSSMIILMGKNEETPSYHKSNALHVSMLVVLRHCSKC